MGCFKSIVRLCETCKKFREGPKEGVKVGQRGTSMKKYREKGIKESNCVSQQLDSVLT